ncbi:hypothetical protein MHU86_12247 [Fragilaria crotonensis]|nr:hypothetical protein MHU86_12247 [Fragilaria crotonensis]
MFTKPWRQDHMKTHMLDQHAQRFEEYVALPSGEKEAFFDTTSVGAAKQAVLAAKFSRPVANDASLNVWVDKAIVEGIIGNMLFDPDDDDTLTKERFMSVFKIQEQLSLDVDECEGRDEGEEHYAATVASKVHLLLHQNDCKWAFLSTSIEGHARHEGDAWSFCTWIDDTTKVSSFARVVCAANLQTISAMLKRSWAFSIALDGGNNSDTSYLDIRIRIVSANGILSILHLLAIPMRERHTGEHMFNLTSTLLDNLVPDWRSRIISVTTDGASSMTGQYRGVASRLSNVALPGFYRVWCALHQLDLVLQRLYNALCDDSFVGTVTSLTGHLRRQFNLIATMGSKCPRFVNTRWMSMSKVVKWLVANRVAVNEHLATKTVNWLPTDAWWIVVCCLNRVMKIVDVAIVSLQGQQLQVSTQRQILDGLKFDLSKLSGSVLGPLTTDEIARLNETHPPTVPLLIPTLEDAATIRESHVFNGKFAMRLDDAHHFIDNCGSFVMERLQKLSAPEDGGNLLEYAQVLKSVGRMFVDLINGVDSIQAERDSSNASADYLVPPSTPSQLQFMSNRDFSILLQQQRERLLHTWQSTEIDALEEQFDDMKQLLAQDARIKAIIENEKVLTSFAEAWAPFDSKRFDPLKLFFGGLATIFPGTATVESDFSLINWEKDDYHSSLTDFSLEGILHSKQYFELLGIASNHMK